MLDRLLHRSVVLNLDGESYRLRAHQEAAEQLRNATTGTPRSLLPRLTQDREIRRAKNRGVFLRTIMSTDAKNVRLPCHLYGCLRDNPDQVLPWRHITRHVF